MRIVVFGRIGQLGTELARCSWSPGTELVFFDRDEVDVGNPAAVKGALAANPCDLVINASGYTAVDRAETDAEAAFAVNRDGPAAMAEACAAGGMPLFHVSTDYVFDGTKPTPYTEDDPIAPLGVYGHSKAEGEQLVRDACPRHIILRTAWVYAAHGHNFVRTMLRLAAERPELRVVGDQHGCPTAAADLAGALHMLAERYGRERDLAWGTYHFTGQGETTWHGLAERAIELAAPVLGKRPVVQAITTADYPTPARRPANSRLDCGRMTRVFGITARPWPEALAEAVAELLRG
jgi:dTDP-4-dehydrorhamnose reductase